MGVKTTWNGSLVKELAHPAMARNAKINSILWIRHLLAYIADWKKRHRKKEQRKLLPLQRHPQKHQRLLLRSPQVLPPRAVQLNLPRKVRQRLPPRAAQLNLLRKVKRVLPRTSQLLHERIRTKKTP